MLKKFLRHFFILVLAIAGFLYLGVRGYDYLYSDKNLLSRETCLKYSEQDVLGKKPYSETCPRLSYSEQVEILSSVSGEANKSGGFAFKFHPIPGNEKACPAVTIVVSRHTGEVWVTNAEKPAK